MNVGICGRILYAPLGIFFALVNIYFGDFFSGFDVKIVLDFLCFIELRCIVIHRDRQRRKDRDRQKVRIEN